MKRWMMSLTLSLALVACNQSSSQTQTAATPPANAPGVVATEEMTPEQLGELGARITKQPDQAKQLLSEKGLDEKTFETKIRKVTEDPAASKRYAAAFEKAKA
jgi:hypothetical protein